MTCRQLVLASTSPFRRELLNRLEISFKTANPQTDESALPGESPEELALRLSEAKARAVVPLFPDALIIGSDQVASLESLAGKRQPVVRGKALLGGLTVRDGVSRRGFLEGYALGSRLDESKA